MVTKYKIVTINDNFEKHVLYNFEKKACYINVIKE